MKLQEALNILIEQTAIDTPKDDKALDLAINTLQSFIDDVTKILARHEI